MRCMILFILFWSFNLQAREALVEQYIDRNITRKPFPTQVLLHPLIVVHAQVYFDRELKQKEEMDKYVRRFMQQGLPVYYLIRENPGMTDQRFKSDGWYLTESHPDGAVSSYGGEHDLKILTNEVTVIGGFFAQNPSLGCLGNAVGHAIYHHFQLSSEPLTIHLPIHAMYHEEFQMGDPEEIAEELSYDWNGTIDFLMDGMFFEKYRSPTLLRQDYWLRTLTGNLAHGEADRLNIDTTSYKFVWTRNGKRVNDRSSFGDSDRNIVYLNLITEK